MSKDQKYKALIIHSDSPPNETKLKRQLLFFDQLMLIDPMDSALINDGEVSEKFGNLEIKWAPRGNFPRIDGYEDKAKEFLQKIKPLESRGLVSILPAKTKAIDPGVAWTMYGSAISNESLVKAAVPDINLEKPTIHIPSGVIYGMALTVPGYKSKYDVSFAKAAHLPPEYDQSWTALSHLRIARAIKSLRRSFAESALPISLDDVNGDILSTLITTDTLLRNQIGDSEDLAQLSISLDVVDPQVLENILKDMSWQEVLRLRKELFPKIARLRHDLINSMTSLNSRSDLALPKYLEALQILKKDFESKKSILADEWDKLKIVGSLKAATAEAGANLGLTLLNPATSWIELSMRILGLGLVGAVSVSTELKTLLPAHKKVRSHPLFFTDSFKKKK